MSGLTRDDATFEQWMARIDRNLLKYRGFTTSDIADRLYRDAYDDGVSTVEITQDILDEGIDAL